MKTCKNSQMKIVPIYPGEPGPKREATKYEKMLRLQIVERAIKISEDIQVIIFEHKDDEQLSHDLYKLAAIISMQNMSVSNLFDTAFEF